MTAPFGLEYKSAALAGPALEHKTALAEADTAQIGTVLATTDGGLNAWQRKSAEFDLSRDPEGTAWLIAAVTGVVDEVNDVIVPGAFRRTLAERPMKGVKGHDWNRRTAVQRKAMELLPGDPRLPDTLADGRTPWPAKAGILLVKAQYLLNTRDGREAWEEVKADESHAAQSIGYKVTDGGAKIKSGQRWIYDLDVYEWSNVLHGAHPMANALAVKTHPAEVDWQAWAALPTAADTSGIEGKARNLIRRVIDPAYWGRPVGTVITPGMKPAGPRARAGGRDRAGQSRTAARVQTGVAGGMGRAGLGGLKRDTADAMKVRRAARGPKPEDIDRDRARQAYDVASSTSDPVRLAAYSDEELTLAAVIAQQNQWGRELDRTRENLREARKAVARKEGIEVREGESAKTARARLANVGDVETARSNLRAFKKADDARKANERGYYGDYGRDQNVAAFLDEKRPLLASDDGRVVATLLPRTRGVERDRWAVIDSVSGDILSENEGTDDVHDFVDGAADRIAEQEERDGTTGRDGGAALADASAAAVRGDDGGGADSAVRRPGEAGGGADRGPGGRTGGAGQGRGDVRGEGGSARGGAAGSGVGGGAGDDSAGSGDDGTDGTARGGRGAAPGSADADGAGGAGVRGRRSGVLGGEGSGEAGDDDGLAADDAGVAHGDVTAADVPDVDLVTAQRIDTVPPGDDFTPTLTSQAPAGARAKLAANMEALRTLRDLQRSAPPRNATAAEQAKLAKWAGWGGLPQVFDDRDPRYATEREELRGLLSASEWMEGEKNTLNAHYTDPRVTSALWDALGNLGFDGGRVLEPGAGSGNFIGFAPENADMVGVELDSTTAGIAKYLYPNSKIRNESFAKSRIPDGSFDAAVGNVPFGRYALLDPVDNAAGHSIHNHFILKALKKTRPGGTVALLTSRFTMDSMNSKAREEMAQYGDLVAAVRLPTGSHRKTADTDVIEDVLIFRRREDGAEPLTDQSWVKSARTEDRIGTTDDEDGDTATLNPYWAANPGNVLGTIKVVKGRYGADIRVDGDRDMGELPAVLRRITDNAKARGLAHTGRVEPLPELIDPDTSRTEGDVRQSPDGTFTQAINGEAVTFDVPKTQRAEFGALLGLRDSLRTLLRLESVTREDNAEITAARARLNTLYDAYVDKYGPVNRYSFQTNGNRKNPEAPRLFRNDPSSALVRALESYDPNGNDGKGSATKASVFTKRASAPREIATKTDSPADAVSLSLDTYSEINLPAIAEMLDTDEADARRKLGTLVFEVPALTPEEEEAVHTASRLAREAGDTGEAHTEGVDLDAVGGTRGDLVPRAEYLSGNVRRKLAIARAAAQRDPRFAANVAELEKVIPKELGTSEIDARLGAAWIDPETVAEFVRSLLRLPEWQSHHVRVRKIGTNWTVEAPNKGTAAREEWGTEDRPLPKLLEHLLEQSPINIKRSVNKPGGGKGSVPDYDATVAAQAKGEALQERFAEWVWEDADRARKLTARYNDQFNSIALRSYNDQQRTFPGMGWGGRKPREHQVAAVNRIVAEPTALLGHVVGAGKTAEMVMGAAELRRLGLARKPAIVVPNHMLEQFTREYLEIYPNANILAAGSEDLEVKKDKAGRILKDGRRDFAARAATGDWDAVILTQKAFEAIPMSPDQQRAYIERELASMRAALEEARRNAEADGENADKDKSIKDMAKAIQSAETAMEKNLEKGLKDEGGVTFEETGIDYLFVDEAHHYSNLRTPSRIQNASASGSGMATDLHMKMEYLRATTESGRVATFATGTPIRNTMTQAYIMMRYLRPDLLEEAGIASFDTWAATFGEVIEEPELKPEGNGYRQVQRFAKFRNVPELLRIMHTFSDIKLAEDLKLPTPKLRGGRPRNIIVPGSEALENYIAELGARADAVRNGSVEPEEDNMLKISGDGRKAALSMALVGEDHEVGKVEAAADQISTIYEETKDRIYPNDPDNPAAGDHPTPGGLQIVFLDMGTPKTAADLKKIEEEGGVHYDAYGKLRDELVARGMDRSRIRFMHEAKNDAQKAELFAAARSGQIDVLIGSTEKMGVGTNVQARAVALHHLDAPWRPADVEQRDGRIMRQGNLNPEVQVLRYVTEGSFDTFMWQTLERKAKFIGQVMKGTLDVREIEDIGDTALSYAELKAASSGNPDLMIKTKTDALRTRLERLSRTHARTQTNLTADVGRHTLLAEQSEAAAERLAHAVGQRTDTSGDKFRATDADGNPYTSRGDAADALRAAMIPLYGELRHHSGARARRQVMTLGGHSVIATWERTSKGEVLTLSLDGVPGEIGKFTQPEIAGAKGPGMAVRVENFLRDLDAARVRRLDVAANSRREIELMTARIGQPFPKQHEMEAAQAKSRRLALKMKRDALRAERLGKKWTRDRLDELPEPTLDPDVNYSPEQIATLDLRWDPAIDTDRDDDPILGRDGDAGIGAVEPVHAPDPTPELETVPDAPSPREVTSPEGEVVDDPAAVRGPEVDGATMADARADADTALIDGDAAALALALERMGVTRDDGRDELAAAMVVLDEDTQRRRLDQIELLNAAPDAQGAIVARQRERAAQASPVDVDDEGDTAEVELDDAAVAEAAALDDVSTSGVPQNGLPWAVGSATNLPDPDASSSGGSGRSDGGGAGTSRSFGRGPGWSDGPQARPDVAMAMGQGGTAPTPESSRARTNRINAALNGVAGGHGGAGSRRVKDGSVHFVSADDNPDAIARSVEALGRLGWAGMVVYPTTSFDANHGTPGRDPLPRRMIEVRVPDIGEDGHPAREFTAPTASAEEMTAATDANRARSREAAIASRAADDAAGNPRVPDGPTGTAFDARDEFDSGTGTIYSTTPTPALIDARDSIARQAASMERVGNTVLAEKMRANVAGYDAEIAQRPDRPDAAPADVAPRRFLLNTEALSARDRGRLDKHLDSHVRYEGRLITNRELYDQRGIRVEEFPNSRRPADRYRLITDEETGAFLPVPKMVFDAATSAASSGTADPVRNPADEIHPDWQVNPFAAQLAEMNAAADEDAPAAGVPAAASQVPGPPPAGVDSREVMGEYRDGARHMIDGVEQSQTPGVPYNVLVNGQHMHVGARNADGSFSVRAVGAEKGRTVAADQVQIYDVSKRNPITVAVGERARGEIEVLIHDVQDGRSVGDDDAFGAYLNPAAGTVDIHDLPSFVGELENMIEIAGDNQESFSGPDRAMYAARKRAIMSLRDKVIKLGERRRMPLPAAPAAETSGSPVPGLPSTVLSRNGTPLTVVGESPTDGTIRLVDAAGNPMGARRENLTTVDGAPLPDMRDQYVPGTFGPDDVSAPTQFADRNAVADHIAAAGPANRSTISAALRGVAANPGARPDDQQLRMLRAATAGRGPRSNDFDAAKASAALQRLADGDVTLPANSVGQRIVFDDLDGARTTGTVTAVEVAGRNQVRLTLELDEARDVARSTRGNTPLNAPRQSATLLHTVDADATLTLADPPPMSWAEIAAANLARDENVPAAARDRAPLVSPNLDSGFREREDPLPGGSVQDRLEEMARLRRELRQARARMERTDIDTTERQDYLLGLIDTHQRILDRVDPDQGELFGGLTPVPAPVRSTGPADGEWAADDDNRDDFQTALDRNRRAVVVDYLERLGIVGEDADDTYLRLRAAPDQRVAVDALFDEAVVRSGFVDRPADRDVERFATEADPVEQASTIFEARPRHGLVYADTAQLDHARQIADELEYMDQRTQVHGGAIARLRERAQFAEAMSRPDPGLDDQADTAGGVELSADDLDAAASVGEVDGQPLGRDGFGAVAGVGLPGEQHAAAQDALGASDRDGLAAALLAAGKAPDEQSADDLAGDLIRRDFRDRDGAFAQLDQLMSGDPSTDTPAEPDEGAERRRLFNIALRNSGLETGTNDRTGARVIRKRMPTQRRQRDSMGSLNRGGERLVDVANYTDDARLTVAGREVPTEHVEEYLRRAANEASDTYGAWNGPAVLREVLGEAEPTPMAPDGFDVELANPNLMARIAGRPAPGVDQQWDHSRRRKITVTDPDALLEYLEAYQEQRSGRKYTHSLSERDAARVLAREVRATRPAPRYTDEADYTDASPEEIRDSITLDPTAGAPRVERITPEPDRGPVAAVGGVRGTVTVDPDWTPEIPRSNPDAYANRLRGMTDGQLANEYAASAGDRRATVEAEQQRRAAGRAQSAPVAAGDGEPTRDELISAVQAAAPGPDRDDAIAALAAHMDAEGARVQREQDVAAGRADSDMAFGGGQPETVGDALDRPAAEPEPGSEPDEVPDDDTSFVVGVDGPMINMFGDDLDPANGLGVSRAASLSGRTLTVTDAGVLRGYLGAQIDGWDDNLAQRGLDPEDRRDYKKHVRAARRLLVALDEVEPDEDGRDADEPTTAAPADPVPPTPAGDADLGLDAAPGGGASYEDLLGMTGGPRMAALRAMSDGDLDAVIDRAGGPDGNPTVLNLAQAVRRYRTDDDEAPAAPAATPLADGDDRGGAAFTAGTDSAASLMALPDDDARQAEIGRMDADQLMELRMGMAGVLTSTRNRPAQRAKAIGINRMIEARQDELDTPDAPDAEPAESDGPDLPEPGAPQVDLFGGEDEGPSQADQDGADLGEPVEPDPAEGPSAADQDGADQDGADLGADPLADGTLPDGYGPADPLDDDGAPMDPAQAAAEAEGAAAPGPDQATLAADTLEEAQQIEADALGIVEADDGEVEVTPDVAQRQSRVEKLVADADAGRLDVGGLADSELTENRRDVVDELRLQEALHRRDLQRRREAAAQRRQQAEAMAAQQQAALDPMAAPDGEEDAAEGMGVPAAPAAPAPDPTPKRRPGLAGAVEDLADALDGGDPDAVMAGVRRARTSLARSGGGTAQHDELAALLADEQTPLDPARLRELAGALRENARAARNSRAKARRLAKRIERDRLRSLAGQLDAELRNRGRRPEDFGGALPQPGPTDAEIADELGPEDGPGVGGDPGVPAEQAGSGPDAGPVGEGNDGDGAGVRQAAAPPSFDRADPDGPAGQARTTALVDGLTAQPWRLLGNPVKIMSGLPEQDEKRRAAARVAFADVLDKYGASVRRRSNEDVEEAARKARALARRRADSDSGDMSALTFGHLLPKAQQRPFMDELRKAVAVYKRELGGGRGGRREAESEGD